MLGAGWAALSASVASLICAARAGKVTTRSRRTISSSAARRFW